MAKRSKRVKPGQEGSVEERGSRSREGGEDERESRETDKRERLLRSQTNRRSLCSTSWPCVGPELRWCPDSPGSPPKQVLTQACSGSST